MKDSAKSHEENEKQLKIRNQVLSGENLAIKLKNSALEARVNELEVDDSKLKESVNSARAASRIWCKENRALSEKIRDLQHEVKKHKKKTDTECEKRRREEEKRNIVESQLTEHLARCQVSFIAL